jgi:hypothetical protein
MKKFFLFFLFLKVRYNWYKSNYCCIPTLNRSFLYQDPHISFGTIGTNVSKSKQYQRFKGYILRIFYYIFLFYKSRSIHRP